MGDGSHNRHTCGDFDLRSASLRAGDGLRDFVRCGKPATHRLDNGCFVCGEHLDKRIMRGDGLIAEPVRLLREDGHG